MSITHNKPDAKLPQRETCQRLDYAGVRGYIADYFPTLV